MLLVLALGAQADLTLTAMLVGVGLGGSNRALTVIATGVLAVASAIAVFVLWTLWSVAPGCVVAGEGCAVPAETLSVVALVAAAEWLWLLVIALIARRVGRRNASRPVAAG
jgi:hypothetical protein